MVTFRVSIGFMRLIYDKIYLPSSGLLSCYLSNPTSSNCQKYLCNTCNYMALSMNIIVPFYAVNVISHGKYIDKSRLMSTYTATIYQIIRTVASNIWDDAWRIIEPSSLPRFTSTFYKLKFPGNTLAFAFYIISWWWEATVVKIHSHGRQWLAYPILYIT